MRGWLRRDSREKFWRFCKRSDWRCGICRIFGSYLRCHPAARERSWDLEHARCEFTACVARHRGVEVPDTNPKRQRGGPSESQPPGLESTALTVRVQVSVSAVVAECPPASNEVHPIGPFVRHTTRVNHARGKPAKPQKSPVRSSVVGAPRHSCQPQKARSLLDDFPAGDFDARHDRGRVESRRSTRAAGAIPAASIEGTCENSQVPFFIGLTTFHARPGMRVRIPRPLSIRN
jgi:hypothetical protein